MFRQRLARRDFEHAFSLIEILITVALLVALGAGLSYVYLGGGKGQDKTKTPIGRAKSVECMSNLQSVRQAIMMASQMGDGESKPQSLQELKLPSEVLSCPIGKEPYVYDPQTGQVHCVHPGHENY